QRCSQLDILSLHALEVGTHLGEFFFQAHGTSLPATVKSEHLRVWLLSKQHNSSHCVGHCVGDCVGCVWCLCPKSGILFFRRFKDALMGGPPQRTKPKLQLKNTSKRTKTQGKEQRAGSEATGTAAHSAAHRESLATGAE